MSRLCRVPRLLRFALRLLAHVVAFRLHASHVTFGIGPWAQAAKYGENGARGLFQRLVRACIHRGLVLPGLTFSCSAPTAMLAFGIVGIGICLVSRGRVVWRCRGELGWNTPWGGAPSEQECQQAPPQSHFSHLHGVQP